MAIIGIIKLRIRPVILVDEFFNPMFLAANPRCYGGPRAGDIIGSSDLRIP